MNRCFLRGLPYLFKPAFNDLQIALNNPQVHQDKLKNRILYDLSKTVYGQAININKNSHWSTIPIVTYDNLAPWIYQQKQHPERAVITPERIFFWQKTSGSSGTCKDIPYSRSLIRTFSSTFCVWAYDLLRHGPDFHTAKAYVCTSPTFGNHNKGIDDTDYLLPPLRWLSRQFLVQLGNDFPDGEAFRWALALALLKTEDLEIISLWSPSFFTVQLEFIQNHNQKLIECLGDRLNPHRKAMLKEKQINWSELWPNLKLISCWDRLFAAEQAQVLQSYFSKVFLQGKGLLATEAPVTIPLINAGGFVPLVNQIVLEFIDPAGEIVGLQDLQENKIYELVISTLGGLYRYRLGDRLKVSHWYKNTPCLEMVGRGDRVSDMVGEKLTEEFVGKIFCQLGLHGACYLSPCGQEKPRYCLWVGSVNYPENLAENLEMALQQSFQYQMARQLGQLDTVEIIYNQIPPWLNQKRWGDRKDYHLQIPPPG